MITDITNSYVNGSGTLVMSFFSGIVNENDHAWPQGCSPSIRAMPGLWVEEYSAYAQGEANTIQIEGGQCFDCHLWSDVIPLNGTNPIFSTIWHLCRI
ncbi:MAG: beta-galactosidase trimerization domain-containing protein [Anaerolineae bacterium]|nr:beta-galactosidase trimerization domain-containing protein [Anaerolineae bacterium]